jgi:hypothetical protein
MSGEICIRSSILCTEWVLIHQRIFIQTGVPQTKFEVPTAATCLAYTSTLKKGGSIFLRNVGELPYYTALHPRRQHCSK